MPLRSEVPFASFLAYSPRGTSERDLKSREIRDAIKQDRRDLIALAALRLRERLDEFGLGEFLGDDVLLIPAPRSAPLSAPEALWPAKRICEELLEKNLGNDILPCLERRVAVPKAAFAKPGERTRAQRHFETMRVVPGQLPPDHRHILVVDDFVTTGSMLLAASSLISDAFPGSRVLAFGLVRPGESVDQFIVPAKGLITLDASNGSTRRVP